LTDCSVVPVAATVIGPTRLFVVTPVLLTKCVVGVIQRIRGIDVEVEAIPSVIGNLLMTERFKFWTPGVRILPNDKGVLPGWY